MTQLSENFTLAEATKSQTALKNGINNEPDAEAIDRIEAMAYEILQPVRDHYGIGFSPSSWFRCLVLNRIIGSKDTSQHVSGEAVDFEVPGVSNMEVIQWMTKNLDFDQIILEFWNPDDPNAGWIHASYKADGMNRKAVLTFDGAIYERMLV